MKMKNECRNRAGGAIQLAAGLVTDCNETRE